MDRLLTRDIVVSCFSVRQTSESKSSMATTEEDFPRGGIVKQPVESRIVVQREEVDNLFQVV